jgi:hypothetical protein
MEQDATTCGAVGGSLQVTSITIHGFGGPGDYHSYFATGNGSAPITVECPAGGTLFALASLVSATPSRKMSKLITSLTSMVTSQHSPTSIHSGRSTKFNELGWRVGHLAIDGRQYVRKLLEFRIIYILG